jgi:guanylate kinase
MENRLDHLAEFREILAHYRISDTSKQILDKTKLALLVAPTAGGRNTIIRELLKTGAYHYIVSDTTRHPRVNNGVPEQNGIEYWFRNEEEVLADLNRGKFLEAAVIHNQQVSGISIRELEQAMNENKIALADIEIIGMQNIIEAKPDTYPLFVIPPSFKEWLKRLDSRGQMAAVEKQRRLQSAYGEFKAALEKDYYLFVINDTIPHAVEQIQAITHGHINEGLQLKAKALAEELKTKLETSQFSTFKP